MKERREVEMAISSVPVALQIQLLAEPVRRQGYLTCCTASSVPEDTGLL